MLTRRYGSTSELTNWNDDEDDVSISYRYGSTQSQCKECLRKTHDSVSISHRYGSTIVTDLLIYRIEEFQSLIGTVQRLVYNQWNENLSFQSLIGTVQQQCLLRFMFSLYLISTVFQSFSPKKSVNLFIVNSRKALILLAFLFLSKLARRFTDFSAAFLLFSALFHAVFVLEALILLPWRFTDFFYRFFNNLCFNQRKSSSPLTKTEAPFEYLNHTCDPAFAVHPCPSPIFCH